MVGRAPMASLLPAGPWTLSTSCVDGHEVLVPLLGVVVIPMVSLLPWVQ